MGEEKEKRIPASEMRFLRAVKGCSREETAAKC
jgi:hypothetical protein